MLMRNRALGRGFSFLVTAQGGLKSGRSGGRVTRVRISSGVKWQVAFWSLCLLAGSGWILGLLNPPESRPLLHLGLESALLAGVFSFLGRRGFAGLRWLAVTLWGAVLVLPAVLSAGAGVALPPVSLALVFTLVPAITVLVEGQTEADFGLGESWTRRMVPALTGVGGAAFLLPFAIPHEAAGWFWLGAAAGAAVLTGIALVRLRRLLLGAAIASAASAVFAGWAIVCLCLGWVNRGVDALSVPRMLALDLQQAVLAAGLVVLTVSLLRNWTAARFSARYLGAPLVTVLEGVMLLRPQISWTLCAGVGALGVAVAMLLRADHADSPESWSG